LIEGFISLIAITLLGAGGFGLMLAFDFALLKKETRWDRLLPVAALLAAAPAHGAALLGPVLFAPTAAALAAGAALSAASLYLLYRSLLADLPAGTYGGGGGEKTLVRTGTYALCRHPGFLWYCGLLAGLFLLSRSQWLLFAGPAWACANLALVAVEDKFIFPRLLPGYTAYRRETPFLIPTARSLRLFFKRPSGNRGG
jgi:protein-S-isoprenylcysteine O-methyltransferase Ste14